MEFKWSLGRGAAGGEGVHSRLQVQHSRFTSLTGGGYTGAPYRSLSVVLHV